MKTKKFAVIKVEKYTAYHKDYMLCMSFKLKVLGLTLFRFENKLP